MGAPTPIPFANGQLVAVTEVPESSYLVRFLVGAGPLYDRMIVVSVMGDTLHLAGWLGKPMSSAEWIMARDALFPDARFVRFERWREDTCGWREAVLRLPAKQE